MSPIRRAMRALGIAALFMVYSLLGLAYEPSERELFPIMITSPNGRYLFKMMPPTQRKGDDGKMVRSAAWGAAYGIGEQGELREIWRMEGWYSFDARLADDGEHLVLFSREVSDGAESLPEPMDVSGSGTDAGPAFDSMIEPSAWKEMVFFEKGKLIRSYNAQELDANASSVFSDVWCRHDHGPLPMVVDGYCLKMQTSDGAEHRLLMTTGERLETKPPVDDAIIRQVVIGNLFSSIDRHLRKSGGGRVILGPIEFRKLDELHSGAELNVFTEKRLPTVTAAIAKEPPNIVVSVRRSNDSEDRTEVMSSYYRANGVEEYWLVDPKKKSVRVFLLKQSAKTQSVTYSGIDKFGSELMPGFEVSCGEVFAPIR